MKSAPLPVNHSRPTLFSGHLVRAIAVGIAIGAGAIAMRADTLMKFEDSSGAGTTFIWASQYFGGPYYQNSNPGDATLSASRNGLAVDVSFQSAPNGPAEGAVNHLRIEATAPSSFQGTGIGSETAFADLISFTGAEGSPYTIYSAYYWRITNLFPNPSGASMNFTINGLDPTGTSGYFLTPADMTGTGGGQVQLDQPYHQFRPDIGQFQPEIGFTLANWSGSTASGGSAIFDVWFTFSNSPITDFNPLQDHGPSTVPESASTFALLALALAGVMTIRRRVA